MTLLFITVHSSYFFSDDYVNFQQARESGLTFAYLNQSLFGHWVPGRRLLDWLIQLSSPASWNAVVIVMCLLVGATSALLGYLVAKVTANRRWGWASAVLFPLTAPVAGTVQWYSGAAEPVPALPLTVASCVFVLAYLRKGSAGRLIGSVLLLATALLFDERPVIIVAAFAALIIVVERPRPLTRDAFSVAAPLALFAAYLVAAHFLSDGTGAPETPSPGRLLHFLVLGIFSNALPGITGFRTLDTTAQNVTAVITAVVVAVVVTLGLVARRHRAILPLLWWIALAIAVFAVTGWVRAAEFGASSALEPRYSIVLMPPGILAASMWLSSTPIARLRFVRPVSVVAMGCAVCLGLLATSADLFGQKSRDWILAIGKDARDHAGRTYFDTEVPGFVVPGVWFPSSLLSNVASVSAPEIKTDVRSRVAYLLDSNGASLPASISHREGLNVAGAAGATPNAVGCWTLSGGVATIDWSSHAVDGTSGLVFVAAHVTSSSRVSVVVRAGASQSELSRGFGASAVVGALSHSSWFAAPIGRQRITAVRLELDAQKGTEVCVTDPHLGYPTAVGQG